MTDARVPPQRDVLGAVAAGGALGSLARWGVAHAWPTGSGGFPWPTLAVNVTGCLLIGLLMAAMTTVWAGTRLHRPFLGVGVLGGYTTFSAYALETRDLLAAGEGAAAAVYAAGSVLAGLLAVALGLAVGRSLWGRGVEGSRP